MANCKLSIGHQGPIKIAIRKLGGLTSVARGLGHRNVTTVQGWWDRGVIPAHRQRAVLDLAVRIGVDISAEDIIPCQRPTSVAQQAAAI